MSGIEFRTSDMTREMHHEVTVTQQPAPEPEGGGIAAILRAFLANPVAAMEVIGFIGGMYGLYYTLNHGIEDAKATSEQHYKDLTLQFAQYQKDTSLQIGSVSEHINARMDVLQAADKTETDDIRALFQRGDQRYREILNKLNDHDVTFSKVAAGVEYIQRQLEDGRTFRPHDQRGEIGPKSSYAGGDR